MFFAKYKELLAELEEEEYDENESYEEYVERQKRELVKLVDEITGGSILLKFAYKGEFELAKSNFSQYAIGDEHAKKEAELTDEQYAKVMLAINRMQERIRRRAARDKKKKKQ